MYIIKKDNVKRIANKMANNILGRDATQEEVSALDFTISDVFRRYISHESHWLMVRKLISHEESIKFLPKYTIFNIMPYFSIRRLHFAVFCDTYAYSDRGMIIESFDGLIEEVNHD